ncbi:MAG: nucleotidyl transferase AbiEii/AbiGii toxin family protein [Myxococcales bacterium]|nr:nucleotidyl transferase AbiEii/AbiGii toxin family protein [Myxococcales bacterium]
MNPRISQVLQSGAARGESAREAMRHHVLEGLLRRLALGPEPRALVVRGGLMTRAWVGRRATRDLDLVGDYPFDITDTQQRLLAALSSEVDDGIAVETTALRTEGIWLDTDWPGVRATVPVEVGGVPERITLDVGFGDPLVPDAEQVVYPTLLDEPGPQVWACRAETQVAWKLHGLSEFGERFRPKDLADLYRITRTVVMNVDDLVPAIEAAFLSRRFTLQQARTVLELPHWRTKTASVRWKQSVDLPALAIVLQEVRAHLAEALRLVAP